MEEVRTSKKDINNVKNILDEDFTELDKANMVGELEKFPQSIEEALYLGEEYSVSVISNILTNSSIGETKDIIFLGMGGSAIGGNLLADYLADEMVIPVLVIRGYNLPKFVGKNSLVFAISYSGNTEETLFTLKKSLLAKANVIALSSGGKFEKLSQGNNFSQIKVPAG